MKVRRDEAIWGTVASFDFRSEHLSEVELHHVVDEVMNFFKEIDNLFSTYIPNSEVSQLRQGSINIEQCHEWVQTIYKECLDAREITAGAFDPWAVRGGFDPSGYVKGWAADQGVAIAKAAGVEHIQINAGGDISLAGGRSADEPWNIGIRHPEERDKVAQIIALVDGAIATSGTYERGEHIIDPATLLPAIGARSATVVGPDAGLAEAFATGLIVAGRSGAHWFIQNPQYSAWVIDRHGDQTWAIGAAFDNPVPQ